MKNTFTLIFCALSLFCAAQVPQPLVNPGVYDISIFGPLGSNQAFRNKFTAVKIGSDTVWYFVDLYGNRALMVQGAAGGSGDSTVNALSPLAGNGTTLDPLRFINGSVDGQVPTWDAGLSEWVYEVPAGGANIYNSDGTIPAEVERLVSMGDDSGLTINYANDNVALDIGAGTELGDGYLYLGSDNGQNWIDITNDVGVDIYFDPAVNGTSGFSVRNYQDGVQAYLHLNEENFEVYLQNEGATNSGGIYVDSSGTSQLYNQNSSIGFDIDDPNGIDIDLDSNNPGAGQTLIADSTSLTFKFGPHPYNTYFAADAPLGFLEIGDGKDTLSIPVLSIAPIQLLSSGDGSIDITPGLGGAFDLSVAGGGGAAPVNTAITLSGDTIQYGQLGALPATGKSLIRNSRQVVGGSVDAGWFSQQFFDPYDYSAYRFVAADDSTAIWNGLNNASAATAKMTYEEVYPNNWFITSQNAGKTAYTDFRVGNFDNQSAYLRRTDTRNGANKRAVVNIDASSGASLSYTQSSDSSTSVQVQPGYVLLSAATTVTGATSNSFLLNKDTTTTSKKISITYSQTTPTNPELISNGFLKSKLPMGTFNADVLSYNPTTPGYLAVPANRSTVVYGGTSGTLTAAESVTDLVGVPTTASTIKLNYTPDSRFNDPFTTVRYVHNWGAGTLTLDTDEAWLFSNRGATGTATATLNTGESARLIWDSANTRFVYEIY